jgi:UDP-glucose 4-epimerase
LKVLVTGGSGFVGSHLVDALLRVRGFEVRVVDDLSSGRLENVEQWEGIAGFEFVQGDLKGPRVAQESVDGVDLVFHLAANPDIRVGSSEPQVHFDENLAVTFNVLEAMRKSAGTRRVVFASTSTVYGEASVFPTPESYGPLLPISVYGAAKLGCEALIASYCHTFGFEAALLRFANIVGPRAMHGVIVDFVRKLRENPRELEVLGDGKQCKSYLHVSDLVSAFLLVVEGFGKKGRVEVYNVGTVDKVAVLRIAEIVCEEMRIPKPRFRFNDSAGGGRGWKGDVKTMLLSIDKLLGLGWKPVMNSEDSLRRSCRELLQAY